MPRGRQKDSFGKVDARGFAAGDLIRRYLAPPYDPKPDLLISVGRILADQDRAATLGDLALVLTRRRDGADTIYTVECDGVIVFSAIIFGSGEVSYVDHIPGAWMNALTNWEWGMFTAGKKLLAAVTAREE